MKYHCHEHRCAVSIYRDIGGGQTNWIGTYWPKTLGRRYCAALNRLLEEQAGPGATQCSVCKRMTLHQFTQEPMCGCKP